MQVVDILIKVAWGVGLLLVGVVAFLLIAVAWRRLTAAPPVPWPEGTYVLPTRTWQSRWVGQLYYMSSEKFEDGTPAETGDHHVRWMAEARAAGKRFVGYELFAGNRIILPVFCEDMEYLLVHAQAGLNKHEGYKGLEFILGSKSLITLRDLSVHRRLRALVTPVFQKRSISDIASYVMTKHMGHFVESIQKSIASNAMPGGGGGIVDVARQSQLFSLRTITEAGFKRLDINGTAVDDTFLRATSTLNFSWTDIFPPAIRRNQWIFPTQRNRSSAETVSMLTGACDYIIKEGRRLLAAQSTSSASAAAAPVAAASTDPKASNKPEVSDLGGRKLLLDYLIAEEGLSDEEISSTVRTLLLAAFDTSQRAIEATLYALSMHDEVQQKLVDELRDVVQVGVQPQLEDVLDLPYLNAVLKESLRLWPSAPWSGRAFTQDVKLPPIEGSAFREAVTVSKGMHLQVSVFGMQRGVPDFYSTKKYPNSVSDFIPERWIDDNELAQRMRGPGGRAAWMPFLPDGHSRSCIGKPLAMAEIALAVATIVRSYRLRYPTPETPPRRVWALTMTFKPKIKLHMTKRDS